MPDHDPQSTFWYLNDVPGEFISSWTWAQTRGASPHLATFYASDDRFDGLKNPVVLTIGAPDATMQGSSLAIFENLFLLEKQRSAKGLREYTLADVRWLLAGGSFTGSFNILGYKNRYRPDSVRGGSEPYTRQQAIQIALAELIVSISAREGRVILPAPQITFDLASDSPLYERLPNNLGNSIGGGWAGAGLGEFLPALLGGSADLVVARGGHLRITDKHAAVVNGIDTGLILLDGILDKKEVRWQKPRKCIVQFEQRVGDSFYPAGITGAVNLDDKALILDNVIPKYVAGGLLAENSGVSVSQYQTFDEYLAEPDVVATGITEEIIRKRFCAPFLISRAGMNAPQRERADIVESTIRAAWRRWWRVRDTDDPRSIRRRFADIQLGVIQSDGTTDTIGVICDYEKYFRSEPFDTDNYGFGTLSQPVFDSAGPFVAYWRHEKDLVIEVEQTVLPPALQAVYLGTLVDRIRTPSRLEMLGSILDGEPIFEAAAEFERLFRMRIYYHGLWVATDDPERKRLYEITYPLFPDGEVEAVTTLYEGMTANWLRKHNEPDFKLLNIEGIYAAAAERTAQIKKSYEQLRAGDVTFGGVDVLARTGIEPVGDLHEISINIGTSGKFYEIRTNLSFRPYVAPEMEYPELLQSLHPSEVG